MRVGVVGLEDIEEAMDVRLGCCCFDAIFRVTPFGVRLKVILGLRIVCEKLTPNFFSKGK